jgi:DNA-binding GntR family transcriptional regulator
MKVIPKRVLARRESIYEQILPKLRQDLIEGRWAANQRLPEPLLCEEFGISRTPLRDAFRVLESEGLLELKPHVGAVVTKPEAVDIAGTFDLLSVLEATAAESIARTRVTTVIAKLRKLDERMQAALEKGDHVQYFKLNDEFHRALAMGSRNPALIQIHEKLMWHVFRIRNAINASKPFSRETGTGREHTAILGAILDGRERDAFDLVRAHTRHVGQTVLDASGLEASAPTDTVKRHVAQA